MLGFNLVEKILIFGLAVALLGGAYLGWQTHQRNLGREAERERQVKENAKFVVNARKGAVDFDTCDMAGGLYDFAKGSCKLP